MTSLNAYIMRVYLDHNATSPLRPKVRQALIERMSMPLNPSSVHAEGRAGRKVIERARMQVAALVGADAKAVTFTGGGTEANNTALSPHVQVGSSLKTYNLLFVSAIEHPCVLAGGRFPKNDVRQLVVDSDGIVILDALEQALKAYEGTFVSVMLANNETGVIQPIDQIGELVHRQGGILHVDAVQAAGKIPIDIMELGADLMTLSAHKIGGPQGVGAIVRRSVGLSLPPLLTGGGQELGARGGTENVAGIEGFGVAADEVLTHLDKGSSIAGKLENGLMTLSDKIQIFGKNAPRLPNTTCFSLPGKRAETAVISYDMADIAISSGSACSSGKVGASHVLKAMGIDEEIAQSAIRVSTGWSTTEDDIVTFLNVTKRLLGG